MKTITFSSTGVSDYGLKEHPEYWRELTTVRKTGLAAEGEEVRVIIRNPDDNHRFDLGIYKCTTDKPAYADRCGIKHYYVFRKQEQEGSAA
jgi:hypothetical protein